jgi:hypothetical protein
MLNAATKYWTPPYLLMKRKQHEKLKCPNAALPVLVIFAWCVIAVNCLLLGLFACAAGPMFVRGVLWAHTHAGVRKRTQATGKERRERSNRRRVCSALDLCLLWLATRRRCKAPARRPILKLETVATEPMAVTFTPVPTAHYSFITARVHNIAPSSATDTRRQLSNFVYFLTRRTTNSSALDFGNILDQFGLTLKT